MSCRVLVVGVGVVPFAEPARSTRADLMGSAAVRAALLDAELPFDRVQQAYVGHVYGDSATGQRVLDRFGLTGVPVQHVSNNGATGSFALWLARQAVAHGAVDCALAVGFEQARSGLPDRTVDDSGAAGREYMRRHGTRPELFAKISVKARRHAVHNPYAVFRDPIGEDEVLGSPTLSGPVTRLQACQPACGAAAAVIVSERFAQARCLRSDITIKAQEMVTELPGTADGRSMTTLVGTDVTRTAADRVYESSGVDPRDIPVVELHDFSTVDEALCYEALGLTEEGGAERFILDGHNTYGGRTVVNPSGGLLGRGHPLGATGLAQCAELVWQLRGEAEARQVEGATLALQHNNGPAGTCVVTLYEKVAASRTVRATTGRR